jgi:hypothetical protein
MLILCARSEGREGNGRISGITGATRLFLIPTQFWQFPRNLNLLLLNCVLKGIEETPECPVFLATRVTMECRAQLERQGWPDPRARMDCPACQDKSIDKSGQMAKIKFQSNVQGRTNTIAASARPSRISGPKGGHRVPGPSGLRRIPRKGRTPRWAKHDLSPPHSLG